MTIARLAPLADSFGMHDDMGGWGILMIIGMVIFWGAIVLAIVLLARGAAQGFGAQRRETPAEILDRRFAEGEVSPEEYEQRRQRLGAGPT